MDPGGQQGVLLDLHQLLEAHLVVLLVLVLAPLPLLEIVRVYESHDETLPLVLFDLVRRVHEHFLIVDLREELDTGFSFQTQRLLDLSKLTSNVLT